MNTIFQLFNNPAILSLLIGFAIGVYRLFTVPARLSDFFSAYLIFCIGLKGGMCLGVAHECTPPLLSLAAIGIAIGFCIPFLYAPLLRRITQLDRDTIFVIASQYGSISIVTFVTALSFLHQHMIPYDTFMSAVAGIMEIPALFSGLILIKGREHNSSLLTSLSKITIEIISSYKITLLFIGFFAGYLFRSTPDHILPTTILWPFTALLIAFMIDIGIKIANQREHIHQFSWHLIAFGIYMPIIAGSIGLLIGYALSIQLGSTILFAILLASSSYIAVPAIMQQYAPRAKEVIYLPLSLAITLPFNVIFGIPLFYYVALYLLN